MKVIHRRLTVKNLLLSLGHSGWLGDAGTLCTLGSREGGIPGWTSSGREVMGRATHGLLGMASQSSVVKPADLHITNGVQVSEAQGPKPLGVWMELQNAWLDLEGGHLQPQRATVYPGLRTNAHVPRTLE